MIHRVHKSVSVAVTERVFHLATAVSLLALLLVGLSNPDLWTELHRKDSYDGAGLVENLTVLVLMPAVVLSVFAVVVWGRRLPWWPLRVWVLLWALACVYLAGEEISWGQWIFQWESPEVFAAKNDQGETNLHNMSSWLDQKPRTLVELFIVFGGLVVPWVLARRSGRPLDADAIGAWVLAPSMCWSAAAAFPLVKFGPKLVPGELGDRLEQSELVELAIAWFLCTYLLSYFVRLATAGERRVRLG